MRCVKGKRRPSVWAFFVAFGLGVWLGQVQAQTLSVDPVFSLNGQTHTGFAFRMALSPDEREVVTAAYDKTIRVWDSQTGLPIRRFYLPVRDAEDGAIESISLSPDGERLAVGGSISGFGKGRSVIIMSLRDGRILKVLSGFSLNARVLNWSRDGKHLAVGTDGRESNSRIHVFDSRSWKKVFEERDIKGRIEIIEFRGDGRFFAATNNGSIDSEVFLYKPEGESYARIKKVSLGKKVTWRGSWTADETHFYINGHSYFSGEDLAEPVWPQTRRARPAREGFHSLKESPDGQYVFAFFRGRFETSGKVRRYGDKSLRTYDDVEIPEPIVSDFVILKSGQLIYLGQEGSVASLGPDFKPLWRQGAPSNGFRNEADRLKVSADGRWVTLPLPVGDRNAERSGEKDLAFDLYDPRFSRVGAVKQSWLSPLTSRRDMMLLAWSGTASGSINGKDLPKIHGRERTLSAAIHSTEPAMVVGSGSARLRKVSGDGKLLWMRYLGADVTALALIESSRFVLAATDDGFLRVLRWEDGATVMTYYLQAAERKWLALANSGHYEAGVGAEDLAGWIVNRDQKHMADFFPMSRFRDRYLLPGVVAASLQARDSYKGVSKALEARALALKLTAEQQERLAREESTRLDASRKLAEAALQAKLTQAEQGLAVDAAGDAIAEALGAQAEQPAAPQLEQLPPVVDVISPGLDVGTQEKTMVIRYRVRSPDNSPVIRVLGRVIGRSESARALMPKSLGAEEQELRINLPSEDAEIQLIAENRWGPSVPTSIRVRWQGEKASGVRQKGVLHVVAVGVSEYDNPAYRLGYAAKDAKDFVSEIGKQAGGFYSAVKWHLLTDKDAGKTGIESTLANLRNQVDAKDTTMVFLAGHGINDPAGGEYLYLPREANLGNLGDTGVSFRKLGHLLASLPGKTIMFVDTCHSGNVLTKMGAGLSQGNTAAVNELASSEKNIIVFASSTGDQESLEKDVWGNGAFTKALLEGFAGKADLLKRGRVTYKQLDAYVADRVDELTDGKQTPVTPVLLTVPDFTLTEVKK